MILFDKPTLPGDGRIVVAEYDEYWVDIVPMLFNHRVTMTPKATIGFYDYAWCYPSWKAAILAVAAWDPATEAEPPGAIKNAMQRLWVPRGVAASSTG